MGLEYTLILNGAFMDNIGTPYMPQFDLEHQGKLDNLQNDRYPQIEPKTVKQFLSQGGV